MRLSIFILILSFMLSGQKININDASKTEIKSLPINNEKALSIIDYLKYVDQVSSIYEL